MNIHVHCIKNEYRPANWLSGEKRKRQAGRASKWNMACNTIEVKLDDKRVCDCFVGRSSFAALHSCHEDHPPKPQWHHHLTQLSPATVRALDYLLWKYFCFPFTLKLCMTLYHLTFQSYTSLFFGHPRVFQLIFK